MSKNISVVFFVNNEPQENLPAVTLPRRSSFMELRQRWYRHSVAESVEDVVFTFDDADGAELPDDGIIDDYVRTQNPILLVHVNSITKKTLRLIGTEANQVDITPQGRETPQLLLNRVRGLLNIDENRPARLQSNGRNLDEDAPIMTQLGSSSVIHLDLQCHVSVICMEAVTFHDPLLDSHGRYIENGDLQKSKQNLVGDSQDPMAFPAFEQPISYSSQQVFASELGHALAAGRGEAQDWRATNCCNGARIGGDEAIVKLLTEENLLEGAPARVILERRMFLNVENRLRGRKETVPAWPSTKLSGFLTHGKDIILINGQKVNPDQSLWEAGLQSGGGITITRLTNLTIFDDRGAIHVVRADLGEPISDLRQRIDFAENSHFQLWLDGRVLKCDARSLMAHNIDANSHIYVRYKTRDAILCIGNEEVDVPAVKKGTSFSAFLRLASAALEVELPHDTHFICRCGRVLSDESEERREFPLRCCSARAARFTVESPTDQDFSGRTLTARFRAPQSASLTRSLQSVKRLSISSVEKTIQMAEEELLRSFLRLNKAQRVRINPERLLHFEIDCDGERLWWSARQHQPLHEVLSALRNTIRKPVVDLAVRGNRCLYLQTRLNVTFAELRIQNGQRLMAILRGPSADQECQSENTTNRSVKFWIVWLVDQRKGFNLNFSLLSISGRKLREEVLKHRSCPGLILRQRRGKRRKDGELVVEVVGFGLASWFADQSGEKVISQKVEAREKFRIEDDEDLLIPGNERIVIEASIR